MGFRKVIWAVDAFDSGPEPRGAAVEALRGLVGRFHVTVQPVYVFCVGQLTLSEEGTGPWVQYYQPAAERALAGIVSDVPIQGIEKPKVILQRSTSSLESAELLSQYAFSEGAELILVSTHARSGIRRLFLGSFAETLVLHSQVPVMVVGSQIKKPITMDKLIYPTEFGLHSRQVFRRAVSIAKQFNSKLILFHSIPHPVESFLQSGVYLLGGGSWVPVQLYFGKQIDRQTRHSEAWSRWAKTQGVDVQFVVQAAGGSIAESVVSIANKERAGCILMEAKSGPISAALIGSVTRQVIRSAPCPVWVMRASMWEEAEKAA